MNSLNEITIPPDAVHLLSREQAWHYGILPKEQKEDQLVFYCSEQADEYALSSELEIILGKAVSLEKISKDEVNRLLSTYYFREQSRSDVKVAGFITGGNEFLENLIGEAKGLKSSDIHIERYEHKCRVRVRIDGMMVERYLLPKEEYPALVNKIKIMANLDIAEKRLPQDGRIHYKSSDEAFDIRVSVLPTLHGEKVVLRLLNNSATNIDLNSLGLSAFDLENYLQGVKRPNGILLISGPTGSGKTTTLYATLKLLNKETRNILTIEDPVEYTLEGINQVQLKESIGLTFASALRTFLRQDPDVIMVGEIRDTETANMAIRAALTGHLVLSTIHTNSAWGTVSRLMDMGIPGFLVANTLNTTVAQRLVRLLCPSCKQKAKASPGMYPKQFRPFYAVDEHYTARGCEECYFTGYRGRKAVYEVIPVDQELSVEIKQGNMVIDQLLKERGIKTLAENAFGLFAAGETSIEEIYPLLFSY
ncbi:general secretion pathway protein E/type IV pilus assembly protein PilB [Arcticibacter tournemirensis]|uniref:Type II/IV secretion system protein n=1 Tax=Arcticibacter tournemirensis TaxID=699437 RepID=A0A5M9GTS7_9SPHI|nr:GspE/PulE family protein [Arcticibacter tournemirensis]KAA8476158.1 type II/IV secretion system protein [Arcticibacter tournemirensis]TQM50854.1 general secretion pathway protein E/type IV pilus assembly protein PilB [Arcticibacter tournemirensis]